MPVFEVAFGDVAPVVWDVMGRDVVNCIPWACWWWFGFALLFPSVAFGSWSVALGVPFLCAWLSVSVVHTLVSFALVPGQRLTLSVARSFLRNNTLSGNDWLRDTCERLVRFEEESKARKGGLEEAGGVHFQIIVAAPMLGTVDGMVFGLDLSPSCVPGAEWADARREALEKRGERRGPFFRGGKARGIVVSFGGNADRWERDQDADRVLARGFVYVVLNYMGVGESSRVAGSLSTTRLSLCLTGVAALEFATRGLGFQESQIVLIGHSLGGAVASAIAPRCPRAHLVLDRTFSRTSDVAIAYAGGWLQWASLVPQFGRDLRDVFDPFSFRCNTPDLPVKLTRLALKIATRFAASWELPSVLSLATASTEPSRGARIIFFTRRDGVIPLSAQLQTALWAQRAAASAASRIGSQGSEVDESDPILHFFEAVHIQELEPRAGTDSHNRRFTEKEFAQLFKALATRIPPQGDET